MQTIGKIARVLPANPEKVLKAKNQLLADFTDLMTDAEQLLASTAEYSGDTIAGARSKFKGSLDHFKTRVSEAQTSAINQFDSAAAATQQYAHDNPWKVAGIAALAGVLLSALLTNSRRRPTAGGMPAFMNKWLRKDQDRAAGAGISGRRPGGRGGSDERYEQANRGGGNE